MSGPGRAWAGPGHNKNIHTKPRLLISLSKTYYKLFTKYLLTKTFVHGAFVQIFLIVDACFN